MTADDGCCGRGADCAGGSAGDSTFGSDADSSAARVYGSTSGSGGGYDADSDAACGADLP